MNTDIILVWTHTPYYIILIFIIIMLVKLKKQLIKLNKKLG